MTQSETVDRLISRMRARGIATQEMAAILDISAQHLYRIIRRERTPSYPLLQAWARALGGELTAAYVLNWQGRGIYEQDNTTYQTNQS